MSRKTGDEPSSVDVGVYDRVDDPRVLVPRERDPLTGRLTSAGDDRPGKRRRSHDPARPRPRFSRGLVVAAAVVGVFVFAGVAIAVASGGGDDTTTAPAATTGRDDAGTGELVLAQLEGTWRFDITSPRLNYISGQYTAAQTSVAVSGNRIQLEALNDANDSHGWRFTPVPAGVERVSCSADSCGTGITGFVTRGNEIRVVNRATLKPHTAGAGLCGAPPVADAGVVRIASPSSFRFVAGETNQVLSDCFQVLWTVVATKVS